ncbi:MAG: GNAT family N-acetyltransferase [Phototrophicaceae bacterium]|jgi:ribosomal protein S18 acetylase RimI-like enzyme
MIENVFYLAAAQDAPELALMNRQLIEDEGSENPMSVDQLEMRMRHWLESRNYSAVFIRRGDETVGYLLYQLETDDHDVTRQRVVVRQFFIHAAYRRRGIGREAFEQLAAAHFPLNATIILEVLAANVQGRAFWERLGFEPYYTTYRRYARP